MSELSQMTDAQTFDLVAPVAIYHFADLLFKRRAQAALRKLRRTSLVLPRLDDCADWAIDRYNDLFESIVEEHTEGWTWKFDRWGAKAWHDANGVLVFSGDDNWRFPWFANSQSLIERIQQHQQEQEEKTYAMSGL